MHDLSLTAPRLFALLGDAIRQLPLNVVESLEAMLVETLPGRTPHLFVVGKEATSSGQTRREVPETHEPSGLAAARA